MSGTARRAGVSPAVGFVLDNPFHRTRRWSRQTTRHDLSSRKLSFALFAAHRQAVRRLTPAMESTCRLCCKTKPLRVSHIIPAFVWAWLKKTSVGGVRGSEIPNRRIQDGPKLPLLCEACEQMFSVWEREFSKNIFDPVHVGGPTPVGLPYRGTWALKFCVSVSWRALELLKDHGLSHLPESQQRECEQTLETWRKFLTNALPHPGRHEQHLPR